MKSLRIVFMVAILASVVATVWGQKPEKPRFPASTYRTTAKIQLKEEYRMYDSAVVILEEGVHFYPDDAELHFLLGKAYSHKNNFQGMGEEFAKAESLKKGDVKWVDELNYIKNEKWGQVYNQGAKAFNEKNLDTALAKFVTCTIIDPTNYKSFFYVGYAYTLKGQPDQGIPYLETGLKLNPDNPELLEVYADVLLAMGKQKEALENFNKILAKDPKNVKVLINLVSIYSNANDYDQALSYSQKLVEADPTYKDGYFNMGTIYLQKIIQINLALDSLKDASGKYQTDEKSMQKEEELTKKKNGLLTSAQTAFEKVAQLDTADVEAQIYLAQVYQEQAKEDLALEILERLVLEDSTNCDALNQLAIIYAKKGIGDKAKVTWQKAQDCLNRPK
jgi:tetratricopeptide (TPR) repeat protein